MICIYRQVRTIAANDHSVSKSLCASITTLNRQNSKWHRFPVSAPHYCAANSYEMYVYRPAPKTQKWP